MACDTSKLGGGLDLASNMIVAATSGMCVAVIQPCLAERELATGELVRPFPMQVTTGRAYYVCARKSVGCAGPAGLFMVWLQSQAGPGVT